MRVVSRMRGGGVGKIEEGVQGSRREKKGGRGCPDPMLTTKDKVQYGYFDHKSSAKYQGGYRCQQYVY
eukprot:767136-Hanusia_phi.AAC.3